MHRLLHREIQSRNIIQRYREEKKKSIEEKAFISGLLCPQIKNCWNGTSVNRVKVSRN